MAAHAKLSASSAKRWLTCPGSIAISEGVPETTSAAAEEGSAAHALAEFCLLQGDEPHDYLGQSCPDPEYADHTVTEDMADAVKVYTDHIRNYPGEIDKNRLELRVDLSPIDEVFKGMFGTADHILWLSSERTLYVDDYKHGAGVLVEADTDQCKYYALGALHMGGILTVAEKVVVSIIQPRCYHPDGPIRSVTYTVDELMDWMRQVLRPGVLATRREDALRIPSDEGCRFCPGKAKCPELRDKALGSAKLDFDFLGDAQPEKPLEELTPADIAEILDNASFITKWVEAVKAYAQLQLKSRRDATGGRYKLVAGKKSRSWTNQAQAEAKLQGLGLTREDLYSETFLSPAQAETKVGRAQKSELADLIKSEDGAPTMVPASDKRAAWSTAEDDFATGDDQDMSFLE